jgi:hypothetical protein
LYDIDKLIEAVGKYNVKIAEGLNLTKILDADYLFRCTKCDDNPIVVKMKIKDREEEELLLH